MKNLQYKHTACSQRDLLIRDIEEKFKNIRTYVKGQADNIRNLEDYGRRKETDNERLRAIKTGIGRLGRIMMGSQESISDLKEIERVFQFFINELEQTIKNNTVGSVLAQGDFTRGYKKLEKEENSFFRVLCLYGVYTTIVLKSLLEAAYKQGDNLK